MRPRTAVPLALALLAVAGAVPAQAATKKKPPPPITKSYDLTLAPLPAEGITDNPCGDANRKQGTDLDVKSLKVVGPGKLKVEVTGFYGDWDTSIWNSSGLQSGGDGSGTPTAESTPATPMTEVASYKSKKAQTLYVRVCNFGGSPNAHVKYTYTYS